jgi:AmmeMemoRadiSam system protein A
VTNDADRSRLLQIARDAITAHLTGTRPPAAETGAMAARCGGAFVTIHKSGELRGCIGHIEPDDPITKVIAQCAVAAATTDRRFPAIAPEEVPDIEIELSLLETFEVISDPGDIEIGRDGLLVERGRQRGLLLPQVAPEWKWDAETFLCQTCRKAGLPPDAWKQGATVRKFRAEVFAEKIERNT